uniref:Uncharacterized protein n=1 Tax=Leersia perrieri TaxID=77586 RepID=A0A0D9X4A4_9ORYZ
MAKATLFAVLSLLLTGEIVAVAVAAAAATCTDYDVPSMSPAAACQKAGTAKSMMELCSNTLGTETSPAGARRDVVRARRPKCRPFVRRRDDIQYFWPLLPDPQVPSEVRSAALKCVTKYNEACRQINAAVGHLNGCQLAELVADVPAALVPHRAPAFGGLRSSLYRRVIRDRDRTVLALRLTPTVFAFLLTGFLAVTGAAAAASCPDYNVPSLPPAAACQKAATAKPILDLCGAVVGTATSPAQEVTAFVIAAVNEAGTSYGNTARFFQVLIGDTSASPAVREAAKTCIGRYNDAVGQLNAAVGHLRGCQLAELTADIPPAIVAVDDCSTALLRAAVFAFLLTGFLAAAAAAAICSDYNVPSLSPDAACQKAATAKPMLDLCGGVVGTATSPAQEVTAFVIAAVNEADTSYGNTGCTCRF